MKENDDSATKAWAGPRGRLLLFVAGDEANSRRARENLARIIQGEMAERWQVEVVDVLSDHAAALSHDIVAAPALLALAPRRVLIVGVLADHEKVRSALQT